MRETTHKRGGFAAIAARASALVLGLGLASMLTPWGRAAMQDAASALVSPFENTSAFRAPGPPAPEEVLMLQLRNGSIRWGAIESHSPNSFRFTRLDNSGVADVPWSLLDPSQAESLRKQFGYVEVEVDEAYVEGDRLVLEGGGTIEGVIVSREGSYFEIKTSGTLQRVPKSRVRGIESGVQLAALDVYTSEALYGLYLAETDLESPAAQLELARRSESILDFAHAAEHYQAALDLGIDTDVDVIQGMLGRAKIKAKNQVQVEYLHEADRLRKRGQFDKSEEMLAAFETTYEDSELIEDARKQQAKLLLARDAAAKKLVERRWGYWAKTLTRKQSVEDSFEAARTWVTESASQEIQEKVLADVRAKVTEAVQIEDIAKMWQERRKLRYDPASYRPDGTWLLGLEAAQRGMESEAEAARGPVSEVDAQRLAIEQRIKRYVENQRISRGSRRGGEEEDEVQKFWEDWSQGARAGWLLAYYVEQSGDFELREKPTLLPCKTCGGKGAIELIITGTTRADSTDGVASCPLCHGVQVSRRIYYR